MLGFSVLFGESAESERENDVVLLLCQLVVVHQVDTVGVDVVFRVCAEQDRVVRLGADYPDGKFGLLEALADLEVSIVLVQSQESHFSLIVDAFEHEVVAQILVSVMDIGPGLASEHEVDDLLRGVSMLIDESAVDQVHIRSDVCNLPRQNDAVD